MSVRAYGFPAYSCADDRQVFDESEGNWSLHLYGAQNILRRLASVQGGRLKYAFLYTWFLYHEILGGFSQPLQHGLKGPASLQLLHDTHFDKSLVCFPTVVLDGRLSQLTAYIDYRIPRMFRRSYGDH